nr:unnamed protein product [Callosobruchus chinensis]
MHNNTRPHTARITQQYLNDVDIDVLEWLALSLDANPIEHVWAKNAMSCSDSLNPK